MSLHRPIEEVANTFRSRYPGEILLSPYVRFQIAREAELEEKRREEQHAAELERERETKSRLDEVCRPTPLSATATLASEQAFENGAAPFQPPTVRIFDPAVVESRNIGSDQDERKQDKQVVTGLRDVGGAYRRLGCVEHDALQRLDALAADFPNFSSVTRYLQGVVAIALADDRTAQPQHILLDGPPGIGKTLFSQRIADIFGTSMRIVHLETMQTSSDLIGSSQPYSNIQPGLIFDALIEGEYANPVFLLHELDKATGDERFPVASALYNLLESTSKHFRDESQPWLELDASRIIYIATSNNADLIDPPILSRMRTFSIEAPTRDHT